MEKTITKSEKETFDLAAKIAKKAKGGEVYALSGDLGAGKTVFVRGFCYGLGIKKGVSSPTFVLMKVYKVRGHKSIKEVCHIDAYRLKSKSDLGAIGAFDYIAQKNTISLIEWPEIVVESLKKIKLIKINLAIKGNERVVIIKK
jgi:tRNA threonylcarbamoyladenosine biosynthesis protein TsaE